MSKTTGSHDNRHLTTGNMTTGKCTGEQAPPAAASAIADDSMKRHLRKYKNSNPLHQLTLGRFFDAVSTCIKRLEYDSILDFGCGEGLFLQQLKLRGIELSNLLGLDVREDALAMARQINPGAEFVNADLFSWKTEPASFDLVIASQVLEHFYDPEKVLRRLVELSAKYVLLTVPHEPWFRLLNLVRGRDILRLGNHPEHVQHWSPRSFRAFLEPHFHKVAVETSFPFIIAVGTVPAQAP